MKKLFCYLFVTCLTVALAVTVYVQLDPFSMTYIIYILASLMIILGNATNRTWQRMRKIILDKFSIDENAKKEVEQDIVVYIDERTFLG